MLRNKIKKIDLVILAGGIGSRIKSFLVINQNQCLYSLKNIFELR